MCFLGGQLTLLLLVYRRGWGPFRGAAVHKRALCKGRCQPARAQRQRARYMTRNARAAPTSGPHRRVLATYLPTGMRTTCARATPKGCKRTIAESYDALDCLLLVTLWTGQH